MGETDIHQTNTLRRGYHRDTCICQLFLRMRGARSLSVKSFQIPLKLAHSSSLYDNRLLAKSISSWIFANDSGGRGIIAGICSTRAQERTGTLYNYSYSCRATATKHNEFLASGVDRHLSSSWQCLATALCVLRDRRCNNSIYNSWRSRGCVSSVRHVPFRDRKQ